MIELRTLGSLELTSAESTAVGSVLAQPRRAALLCYLALAVPRGFHRRDTLLALFWPEDDAEGARHALRQSIYFLRRALGTGAIVSRGDDELALASDQVRCDAWEFEAALEQGRAGDALALYQGDLLAGFHISDAPDFERWLEAERGRLRDLARDAAWKLAAAREQEGDAAGAAEAARRAVALAPTDEIALRRLVLLLERVGDRAAAVRAYEAFALTLRAEYELEPSAETQAAVARIRTRLSPSIGNGNTPRGTREMGPPAGAPPDATKELGEFPSPSRSPAAEAPPLSLPSRAPRPAGMVARAAGIVLLLGLATLAGLHLRAQPHDRIAGAIPLPTGEPAPGIAVLPFDLQDTALANWREGLMDLVSMDLSGVPGLRAVDSRTVLARWREQVGGTEGPALATALDVAGRAGGRYAVAGSMIADGPELLLTAGVHEVAGGQMLGTARSRGPADSIFTLVDRLTLEILRFIPGVDARELPRIDLARVNTASLPALKAFLEGEVRFRRSQFESAAEAYGRAVEADSTFALARYRLGVSRQWFWNDILSSVPDPLPAAVGRFAGQLPQHEAAMFRAFRLRELDARAAHELLEEETRRHPEDADTWNELGEFYHHTGQELPALRGAEDAALTRAIALDSTFSLPYIHLIEYAIGERDTARAEQLLRTFGRLASGTRHLSQLRLLAGLVVGDSLARSTSEAALDKLEIYRLFWLGFQLAAAQRWDLSEQVFRRTWDRGEHRTEATLLLFFTCLAQGKAHEAHRWVDNFYTPKSRKPRLLDAFAELGIPVPAAEFDALLPLTEADSADAVQLFYLGALAASRGKWQVAQASLEQLRSHSRSLSATGDSAQLYFTVAMRQGLEGYMLWRQGQPDRALRLLQSSRRRALGGRAVGERLRWWLGGLLLEMGRPREALPYFESITGSWLPADYERGRLYEQLGMAEQAREAYSRFLDPRQQADSVFQPMIQDARAALERLAQVTPQ
jgi:serine/threonine-protein kinase